MDTHSSEDPSPRTSCPLRTPCLGSEVFQEEAPLHCPTARWPGLLRMERCGQSLRPSGLKEAAEAQRVAMGFKGRTGRAYTVSPAHSPPRGPSNLPGGMCPLLSWWGRAQGWEVW